jgi:hypothetical protein
MSNTQRSTEEQFNELHTLVTHEFLTRIKSGEATTADLRAAVDWLKANDITGVAIEGSPLAGLIGLIPELTLEDISPQV